MMFMNIFWVLILAVGVFLLIKYLSRTKNGDGIQEWFGSNPLEILKERYAKGEIDRTDYEQRKRDLEEVG
jgi:putative membrane protein